MPRRRLLLLPTVLLAGGVAVTTVLVAMPFLGVRTRNVLILGLDTANWYCIAVFLALVAVIVGMFLAAIRLRGGVLIQILSVLVGLVASGLAVLLFFAGIVGFALSGIGDRTEIPLAHGKSIVVERFSWHHCDVTVLQRDGMFVDTVLGSTFDGMACNSVGSGDYLVNQVGNRVTLTDGTGNVTVTLH